MPSMRKASYSRGRTSRRSRKPKFFIARTTWAMLTRSWGSWRTTTMLMSRRNRVRNEEYGTRSVKVGVARRTTLPCNSAFRTPHSAFDSSHELQHTHPLRVSAVAAQPHPSVPPTPDKLAGAPHAVGEHLVNDKVEPHSPADVRAMPLGPTDGERHAIPVARAPPRAAGRLGRAGRVARPPH